MCDNKKDVSAVAVVGIATGLVVGYVAGILTAPKSGVETRRDIKDATDRTIAMAQQKVTALQAQISVLADQARARAKSLSLRGKQDLDDLIDNAKIAQDKAKAMLVAVKEGEANDPDLQRAVEKANEAKDNLANFLKKN